MEQAVKAFRIGVAIAGAFIKVSLSVVRGEEKVSSAPDS